MFILYFVVGVIGGVLGGMGMGGGTLLIPMLTIFFSVEQHTAQAVNLIAFIPMAVIALIIHLKNKLIDFKKVFLIISSGIVTCVLGCILAKILSANFLKRIFGLFLVLLSIYQFINVKNTQ